MLIYYDTDTQIINNVIINKRSLEPFCVWILFQNSSSHSVSDVCLSLYIGESADCKLIFQTVQQLHAELCHVQRPGGINLITPHKKISSGSKMFNNYCKKLKNENCAHCNPRGRGLVRDVHVRKKIIQRRVNA